MLAVSREVYCEGEGVTDFQLSLCEAVLSQVLIENKINHFVFQYIYDDSLGCEDLTISYINVILDHEKYFDYVIENSLLGPMFFDYVKRISKIKELDGVSVVYDISLREDVYEME